MAKTSKKKNPNDTTFRNINVLKRNVRLVQSAVIRTEQSLSELHQRVRDLDAEIQDLRNIFSAKLAEDKGPLTDPPGT